MKKISIVSLICVVLSISGYKNSNEYKSDIVEDHSVKIYVAGHKGLVGSALLRKLQQEGYNNIIIKTHQELDLTDQQAVESFFEKEKPEYVFLSAAKVGGILANNNYPADFIYTNLMITANILHAAYKFNVKKLLYLGSSCIYPRLSPQPMREEYLLTSSLEKTNESYALAKIAGLKMCQAYNKQYGTKFISCMPTNLYGINDNFNFDDSHVIPGLIAKFCKAQAEKKEEVECWGTGSARREFLYVDDLANAALYLMKHYEGYGENDWINIGTGEDISIKELAYLIKNATGFKGRIIFDQSKPDGTPRKLLDVSRINSLGWKAQVSLKHGLKEAIEWYKDNCVI